MDAERFLNAHYKLNRRLQSRIVALVSYGAVLLMVLASVLIYGVK